MLGAPGVGKTSLLNHVAAELAAGDSAYVVLQPRGRPEGVSEFLFLLATALEQAQPGSWADASPRDINAALREAEAGGSGMATQILVIDAFANTVANLRRNGRRTVIFVDDTDDPRTFRALFGRFRDELWSMGSTWIVAGRADHADELLQPPADAFFGSTMTLGPLSQDAAVAFINARLLGQDRLRLGTGEVKRVAQLGRGHPVSMLKYLRAVVSGTSLAELEKRTDRLEAALTGVSPPARRLAHAVMAGGEPGRASDPALQRSLGWSASRLRQLFHELVEAGAFDVADGPVAGPGRPSKTYVPRGLPDG